MTWISVKDRLPENENPVLVFDGDYFEVAYWDGDMWADESCDKFPYPTHWMPLPEPPQEEK